MIKKRIFGKDVSNIYSNPLLPHEPNKNKIISHLSYNSKENIQMINLQEKTRLGPQQATKKSISQMNSQIVQSELQNIQEFQVGFIYTYDILSHIRKTEIINIQVLYIVSPYYMQLVQTNINEQMRCKLLCKLQEIQAQLNLKMQTLFLAVNLIDRYLEKIPIQKEELSLIGISSIIIASKYEEIYLPTIKDFINCMDKEHTKKDILQMEGKILSQLQFNLTINSSLTFYQSYTQIIFKFEQKAIILGQYILELALIDYSMLKYLPSMIATGIIYILIKQFLGKQYSHFPYVFQNIINYTEDQVQQCALHLVELTNNAPKFDYLQGVYKKYQTKEKFEVNKMILKI